MTPACSRLSSTASLAILTVCLCFLSAAPAAAAPAAPTALTPLGEIQDTRPTFTWSDVGAHWYHVYVMRGNEHYFDLWVEGDTSLASGAAIPVGDYRWWVRGWDPTGMGEWSTEGSFTVLGPLQPAAATLHGPSGPLDTREPVFEWSEADGAQWYWVILLRDSILYHQFWTQETTWQAQWALHPGNYAWYVTSWNPVGLRWSNTLTFQITPEPPPAPVLIEPRGTLQGATRPVFSWEPADTAEWYHVAIEKDNTLYYQQWTQQTSLQTDWDFTAGSYTWSIRAWNPEGIGPWADSVAFELSGLTPAAPTLAGPGSADGGVVEEPRPRFSWDAVNNAQWYWLIVRLEGNTYQELWLTETSWTPTQDLASGSYAWSVTGWNASGLGETATFRFTVPSAYEYDNSLFHGTFAGPIRVGTEDMVVRATIGNDPGRQMENAYFYLQDGTNVTTYSGRDADNDAVTTTVTVLSATQLHVRIDGTWDGDPNNHGWTDDLTFTFDPGYSQFTVTGTSVDDDPEWPGGAVTGTLYRDSGTGETTHFQGTHAGTITLPCGTMPFILEIGTTESRLAEDGPYICLPPLGSSGQYQWQNGNEWGEQTVALHGHSLSMFMEQGYGQDEWTTFVEIDFSEDYSSATFTGVESSTDPDDCPGAISGTLVKDTGAGNAHLAGNFTGYLVMGNCGQQPVTLTVGSDYNRRQQESYLYIPPTGNHAQWTGLDEDSDPEEVTIAIAGNTVHYHVDGEWSDGMGGWTSYVTLTYSNANHTITVGGNLADDDPDECTGALSGTLTRAR